MNEKESVMSERRSRLLPSGSLHNLINSSGLDLRIALRRRVGSPWPSSSFCFSRYEEFSSSSSLLFVLSVGVGYSWLIGLSLEREEGRIEGWDMGGKSLFSNSAAVSWSMLSNLLLSFCLRRSIWEFRIILLPLRFSFFFKLGGTSGGLLLIVFSFLF